MIDNAWSRAWWHAAGPRVDRGVRRHLSRQVSRLTSTSVRDAMLDVLFKYLGETVLYGGGAVAIGFGMFKVLGSRWLEAQFSERLQKLKAEHDEQLRHVQSNIDREIHRARRLYDREFETLPEAWRLLSAAYVNGQATAVERYPDLSRYTLQELKDLLSTTTMREFEKDEICRRPQAMWTEHYRRWTAAQRLQRYWQELQALREYVSANSIFWSPGKKERFSSLDNLVGMAIAEMEQRVRMPDYHSFDEASKLMKEGPALRDELETLIRSRLWSADLKLAA